MLERRQLGLTPGCLAQGIQVSPGTGTANKPLGEAGPRSTLALSLVCMCRHGGVVHNPRAWDPSPEMIEMGCVGIEHLESSLGDSNKQPSLGTTALRNKKGGITNPFLTKYH